VFRLNSLYVLKMPVQERQEPVRSKRFRIENSVNWKTTRPLWPSSLIHSSLDSGILKFSSSYLPSTYPWAESVSPTHRLFSIINHCYILSLCSEQWTNVFREICYTAIIPIYINIYLPNWAHCDMSQIVICWWEATQAPQSNRLRWGWKSVRDSVRIFLCPWWKKYHSISLDW
jgi:hypothetical protein